MLALAALPLAAAAQALATTERGGSTVPPRAARVRPAAASGDARVCVGGDVTLGTNVDTSWVVRAAKWAHRPIPALPDPSRLLRPVVPLFSDADVALVNVEGAIGDGPAPPKCRDGVKGCFALRQPPAAARALRSLARDGEVVGNVANNHARDAGRDGLATTVALLEDAGVHVTGADTLPTLVVTPGGDTVAFLGFGAGSGPDLRDLEGAKRWIARAAAAYPRLVVTMHLGAEGRDAQRTRDTMEVYLKEKRGNPVAFAHAAVEAGAKLVVGHGPHVVRGVEWWDGALIAYSLGNLVTYGPFSLRAPLDRGAVLCASLDDSGRVRSAQLRAARQRAPGWASVDRRGRAVMLADSLGRLDFPDSAATFLMEAAVRRPRARWR